MATTEDFTGTQNANAKLLFRFSVILGLLGFARAILGAWQIGLGPDKLHEIIFFAGLAVLSLALVAFSRRELKLIAADEEFLPVLKP